MSNRAQIVRTKFIDYTGETEGVRAFDDYEQTYFHFNSIPESDMELLVLMLDQNDDRLNGILEHLYSIEKGIEIDGTWYDYSEIEEVLEQFFNNTSKVISKGSR